MKPCYKYSYKRKQWEELIKWDTSLAPIQYVNYLITNGAKA